MMLLNPPWTTTVIVRASNKSMDFGFQNSPFFFFRTKIKMFLHYFVFSILMKKMCEIPPPPLPKILNSGAIIQF